MIDGGSDHGATDEGFDIVVEDGGVADGKARIGLPEGDGGFDDVADAVDVEEIGSGVVIDLGQGR